MPPPSTRAEAAFVSRSAALDTDYRVYTHAPDPRRDPGPWPVVLFLDGDYAFDPAVAAYEKVRAENDVPAALIVAVGYGLPFGSPGNHRGRDYTPTASAEEPGSGGADAFLAHLTGKLWPELSRRYSIRKDRSVLAGYSLGALLVLHALFRPRPFFSRFLAGAPSIWWDDRSLLRLAAALRKRQAKLPARLFLGVGAEDTASMLADLALFERQLAERPFAGLEITSVTFPGYDHFNLAPELFPAGLRRLLGTPG
jgi:predicted alpha/beta superfamily hydrolase